MHEYEQHQQELLNNKEHADRQLEVQQAELDDQKCLIYEEKARLLAPAQAQAQIIISWGLSVLIIHSVSVE
jgi:hypothetical protein